MPIPNKDVWTQLSRCVQPYLSTRRSFSLVLRQPTNYFRTALLGEHHKLGVARDSSKTGGIDMRHVLRRIIVGRRDRPFAFASQRPTVIGKTIETILTENEMVEQHDAQ